MRIYTWRFYRKIYEEHYGPIPKDDNGRSYDIHHIDGNHTNNDPTNLIAVSLQEHYEIHKAQGDYGACAIMSHRMKLSPEEKSELVRLDNLDRIKRGTHNFLKPGFQHRAAIKTLESGAHPSQMKRTCEHCGIIMALNNFSKFHGNNCKAKPNT